jgi:ABC-type enterobactin transport system permease subunit
MFTAYRAGIAPAIAELRRSQRLLENIRELAGPSPRLLPRLEQRLVIAKQRLAAVSAPAELGAAHGLFGAAFQMARRAVSTRRNAVSSRDMKLAWDAASAAAGALMLLDRAGQELDKQASPLRNR